MRSVFVGATDKTGAHLVWSGRVFLGPPHYNQRQHCASVENPSGEGEEINQWVDWAGGNHYDCDQRLQKRMRVISKSFEYSAWRIECRQPAWLKCAAGCLHHSIERFFLLGVIRAQRNLFWICYVIKFKFKHEKLGIINIFMSTTMQMWLNTEYVDFIIYWASSYMEYESRGWSESPDVHIGQNVHQVPFTTSSKTQPVREKMSILLQLSSSESLPSSSEKCSVGRAKCGNSHR